jgi:hypothetical protein
MSSTIVLLAARQGIKASVAVPGVDQLFFVKLALLLSIVAVMVGQGFGPPGPFARGAVSTANWQGLSALDAEALSNPKPTFEFPLEPGCYQVFVGPTQRHL